MCKVEFYPKEFHQLELIEGDINREETLCTPVIPDFPFVFNRITMNSPEEITYLDESEDGIIEIPEFSLPICIYYVISLRRSLKYYQLKDTINIRKTGSDTWGRGVVEVIYDNSIPMPDYIEKAAQLQEKREKAQNYLDSELDLGQGVAGAMSFNLFDFVSFPITAGKYEIFFSAKGLESNHIFMDVIINKKR